jgi:hypothetical protein
VTPDRPFCSLLPDALSHTPTAAPAFPAQRHNIREGRERGGGREETEEEEGKGGMNEGKGGMNEGKVRGVRWNEGRREAVNEGGE